MRVHNILLALAALPATALAQSASTPPMPGAGSAQGDVSVTIYNNGQSLVQDVRRLDLAAGRSRQEFPDVSAQIRPETVSLAGPDIGIVEQNFDFDLLSPEKLMEKAVGRTITLIRTNPANGAETREAAKVLAVNGGVVLQINGHIEVLRDDGLPARVIFDSVPENLRARPTLSVTVQAARAGARPAALSYLTTGLGWQADYVALFDEAKGAIDVQGWVTLTNNTGTTFANAKTLLVAGNPASGGGGGRGGYRPMIAPQPDDSDDQSLENAGTESGTRERLGDYYLYPLAERTTIANAQTKQVSFLDVKGASARKAYQYVNGWLGTVDNPASASTVLKFTNGKSAGGLGDQLPAGTVRIYMRDQRGQPQFIGENRIGHTPMGSTLAIRTGDAFDVKVKPVVVERKRLGSGHWQTSMRYTLTNARPEAVSVDLAQDGLWGDTRVTAQSIEGARVSADRIEWKVPVPANGTAELTATFDTRF